jgi:hypothetical protein
VKTGVQCFHNYLRLLDSGFRRNDGHQAFSTFCDFINIPLTQQANNPYHQRSNIPIFQYSFGAMLLKMKHKSNSGG